MPRASQKSPVFRLSYWFIVHYIRREWTTADFKSQHMRHAKYLLADYPMEDVVGCLEYARDFNLWPYPITSLTAVRYGEPSMMSLWLDYKNNPPPQYLESEYADWKKRVGYIEPEEVESGVPVRKEDLRSARPPGRD